MTTFKESSQANYQSIVATCYFLDVLGAIADEDFRSGLLPTFHIVKRGVFYRGSGSRRCRMAGGGSISVGGNISMGSSIGVRQRQEEIIRVPRWAFLQGSGGNIMKDHDLELGTG
jgi:hypothetical protein